MAVKSFEETVLTAEAIKDFQICSLLYDYRHAQNLSEPIGGRELLAMRYENTLKRVASFFFYKKQSGSAPSYNAILNRWEKLWFPKDLTISDIAVEQNETWHGNIHSYNTDAAVALLKFHEDFYDTDWDPILIDENFLVPMTRDIRLSGRFDLVLRRGDEHKVVKYSGRLGRPAINKMMVDFALMRHAFEIRHDWSKRTSYHLYDLGSSKPGFVRARPTNTDLNALYYWAHQTATQDVYAPRRGLTAYCRGCPFDAPCSTFDKYPEIEPLDK